MARMTGKLLKDARGVSDVLAIGFMFLIVIFAGVLLHSYRLDTINSASARQLQLRTEYLYKTLELAQVENYSLTYLRAVADNVIGVDPQVVSGNYLRARIDGILSYLRSPGYGVMIEVTHENKSWIQLYPSDAGPPGPDVEKFKFSGKVTIIIAEAGENRVAQANATLTMFRFG